MEQIKQNSIEHYIRMIKFARMQTPSDSFSVFDMKDKIHETHGSKYCDYCTEYYDENNVQCTECPLNEDMGVYKGWCCSKFFTNAYKSETWGEYVENAKQVLYYIIVFG